MNHQMDRERDAEPEHGQENSKLKVTLNHLSTGDHDFSLFGCSDREKCVGGVRVSRKGVNESLMNQKEKSFMG